MKIKKGDGVTHDVLRLWSSEDLISFISEGFQVAREGKGSLKHGPKRSNNKREESEGGRRRRRERSQRDELVDSTGVERISTHLASIEGRRERGARR